MIGTYRAEYYGAMFVLLNMVFSRAQVSHEVLFYVQVIG